MSAPGNTVTLHFRGDHRDLSRTLGRVAEDLTSFNSNITRTGALLGAITAATAIAPNLIGAALLSVPAMFGAIGIAAVMQGEKVKTAYKDLGKWLIEHTQSLAAPIAGSMLRIADQTRKVFEGLAPALGRIFQQVAPYIEVVASGIFRLVQNAMPGFERAVSAAKPVVDAFANGLASVGTAMTYFFTKMAANADVGAKGITALFDTIGTLIRGLADLLVWLATGATAFHAIHDAVMGVLPILLQLFVQLEKALGPAFQALVPLVMDLARTVSAFLIPIFQMLSAPLAAVAQALTVGLHPAFVALQDVFKTLMPILGRIATQLGNLLVGAIQVLAPLLPPLILAFGEIAEAVLKWIPGLIKIAQLLLPALSSVLGAVLDGVLSLLPPLLDLADQLFPLLLQTVEDLVRTFVSELVPVVVEIAKQLFPVLVEVIKELVPIIFDLARELLPALVEIFDMLAPIIAEIAREVLPIFVSILRDAVIPIIRDVLAPTISALAHDVLPALVRIFRDVLVPVLNDVVLPAIRLLARLWREDVLPILTDYVIPVLRDALPGAVRICADAINALVDAFTVQFEAVKKFFRDLPNGVLTALGDLSKTLFDSGVNLIQGFMDGIRSMGTAVVNTTSNILSDVGNLFPHSPAKEGPFSGSGYTLFSGQALMRDFAEGVGSIDIKGVFSKILSGVSGMFSAQGSPGGGGTVSASVPGVGALQLKVAPGADSALASLLMNMVRTGQLQLLRA